MSVPLEESVRAICEAQGRDRGRLIDILREIQARFFCVSPHAVDLVAEELGIHRHEVEGVVTFYSFLSLEPKAPVVIRLCNDVVDRMHGFDRIGRAFRDSLGIEFGQTTPDGAIRLETTACIGMSDQAPAALINDTVFPNLSTDAVYQIVESLQHGIAPEEVVQQLGDGNNALPMIHAAVKNNIRRAGSVIFAPMPEGDALRKALAMSPVEVIRDVKTARLRGRGGAGFPAGMKWDFARGAASREPRVVICNADEGEPGTFKDRVILTECAGRVLEGMAIAGYAIGGTEGILYLRAEYAYLRGYLEHLIADRTAKGLLGGNICGKQGFSFHVRIQMGAGAYVCGEETALISSCEGRRGDPITRPPFPAQKGYQGRPTIVNNVETFACIARLLDNGPGWFAQMGSKGSAGMKVLSISGDCRSPGIYEVEFGTPLREILKMAGGEDAIAVQMGGPSGRMVGPEDFDRTVCYDDLATGGAVMVIGPRRDILEIVSHFLAFFTDESCGYCTPCRVGNVLMKERVDRIRKGRGIPSDLEYLRTLAESVKKASRCGLGQTSCNPVLSSLKAFPHIYESKTRENRTDVLPHFDFENAFTEAAAIAGHGPAREKGD